MSRSETGATHDLQTAFLAFSEMSVQLESSYRELEQRVSSLTEELAAARSDRIRNLAEKEKLADRLEKLLNGLPGGVVVLDHEGTVRQANPAAIDLLEEPLVGERWSDISKRAFLAISSEANEVQIADGRWVNISSCALESETGWILLLNDVTETRTLQETVNRQQRLSSMGEMVAKLAHQIRTPLSSALLYASHLSGARVDDSNRQRFARRLLDRLRHLESMVTDMLVFARGGSSGDDSFTLSSLVDELTQLLEAQMNQIGAVWVIDNRAADFVLEGNRQALLGALSNLANNSLEIIGTDTCLYLSTRTVDENSVEICLADNGPGIPEAMRERIFDPFFTTRPEGTGLGLAVVQATLAAHDGAIRVESHQGGGACFVITLPSGHSEKLLPGGTTARHVEPAKQFQTVLHTVN